ncbi:MAG: guanitoxin biosynthesis MATE family efflux transporter GntT [Crocosphaera sp.]|nr:guanitoxin biosynthesis MATE family efflux transporter GntT [Crocosphaera sp.]
MESSFKRVHLEAYKNRCLEWLNLPSFSWRFLRLAFINVLSNLMVPIAGLLSITFLGHLEDIHHLAGVTLATIIFNYLYRALGFLRTSTTGITAQGMGRKDSQEVLLVLLKNGLLALSLGLIILVLQYPLRWIGFNLVTAAPLVKASAQSYYDMRILGAPAVLLNFVLIGWFLGKEQSGKVLWLSLVGNGANVILDYLLIIRWGLESGGAGLATSLSQIVMCLMGLFLVIKEINWPEFKQVIQQLSFEQWKGNLMLNRDLFIRTFILLSAFSLFTNVSSAMGTLVLAENSVLLQVFSLVVYFIDGLAFATESLAGNFKGQGSKKQLIPLLKFSGGISFTLALVSVFILISFPQTLFGLLTNHQEIFPYLQSHVIWLLPVLGFGSIAFILDGYFIGLAEGVMLRNTALGSTFIGFVPVATIAWHYNNSNLLWLALSLFMATRVILLGLKIPQTLKN